MNLLHIDKHELQALLQSRKNAIGTNVLAELVNLSGGVSLLLSSMTGTIYYAFHIACIVLACAIIILSFAKLVKCILTPEDADHLYKEIIQLDKVERRSSIVAIKDTYSTYAHRFLLYHDDGWDCDFFPNHRTIDGNAANIKNLSEHLSADLEIDSSDISLQYVCDRTNEKPSTEHHGEIRLYIYSLYSAEIHSIPVSWQKDQFEIAGRHYRWMTTDAMLSDERIREINSDVVSLVRDSIS